MANQLKIALGILSGLTGILLFIQPKWVIQFKAIIAVGLLLAAYFLIKGRD